MKNFGTNETNEKFPGNLKIYRKKIKKNPKMDIADVINVNYGETWLVAVAVGAAMA